VIGNAVGVMRIATGEETEDADTQDPENVERSRIGGPESLPEIRPSCAPS
jgi:hypothetical protein